MGKQHPLASIPVPTLTELNQYKQLVICDLQGKVSQPISSNYWLLDSFYYITGLVSHGVGWALVPEHIAKAEWIQQTGVVELDSYHIPESLLVEVGLVKRRNKGSGLVMEWLLKELEVLFQKSRTR